MLTRRIAEIDAAEDLFELLGQRYDEHVLRVYRVHILKRFGRMVADLHERLPYATEGELRALYAKALKEAHDLYADGGEKIGPLVCRKPDRLVPLRVGPTR